MDIAEGRARRAPPDEADGLGVEQAWSRSPGAASLVVCYDALVRARVMSSMRWGLAEDGRRRLYCRVETLIGRGVLRQALRRRRVIVPVDGYVQHAHRGEAEGRDFAVSRRDGAPMAIAGVWAEAEDGPAFCIITCPANATLALIHDRMPVVLGPEAWAMWLSERVLTPLDVADLLRPCPPDWLSVRPLPRGRRIRGGGQGVPGTQLRLLGLDETVVRPVGRTGRRPKAQQRRRGAHALGRGTRRDAATPGGGRGEPGADDGQGPGASAGRGR